MKKLSAILVCLLMVITCGLAGCASFSINKVKYYNEVLATVDETKITRFELLSAYNSYGQSYYVQQMGKSEEEALSSTLDLLIERELLYQHALENNNTYKPTAYQVNTVIEKMFESLDSQMDKYIETAKNILQIKEDETEEETKEDETAYKHEDYVYSPRARVKSKTIGAEKEYYIEYIIEDEEDYESLIDSQYLVNFTSKNTVPEIKKAYFKHLLDDLTLEEKENATILYNKAISLFANDLIDYEYYLRDENNKAYDKSTESLLIRYFERTFEEQIKSQYLENIRVYYLQNEELSIELLKEEYSYIATNSYNKFNNKPEFYKSTIKDIGTKGDSILYHPETDAEFGYFIHTLISFDSIKENLTLLKEEKDPEQYEIAYNSLISSIKIKARNSETGLLEEEVNITDIINEYNSIAETYSNYDERLSAFIQFMFKYTGDTSTLSAGMPYVIGYNPLQYTGELDGSDKLIGAYSGMVNEFTKEAINLMQQSKGSMSTANLNDIDNLCVTEYGIHLLFYVDDVAAYDIPYGDVENVYIQDTDIEGNEAFNLYTKTINPLTKQTYFDKMFDLVYPASSGEVYTSKNGYSDHEKELIAQSKKANKVTKYVTKIKATKTSL